MVVDEDPEVKDLTVNALSYCVNRDVVSFRDGLSAWQYIEGGNEVDMVISDLDLPGMDGLALLSKFKTRWADKVFILMSGKEKDYARAQSAGADAFLDKPFTINDLFSIVQQYIVD